MYLVELAYWFVDLDTLSLANHLESALNDFGYCAKVKFDYQQKV
jgi:hypothetical protein